MRSSKISWKDLKPEGTVGKLVVYCLRWNSWGDHWRKMSIFRGGVLANLGAVVGLLEGPDIDVEVAGLGAFRGGPEAVLRESWMSWGPLGRVLGRLGAVLGRF